LPPWRDINPNPEKKIFPQRRKDAKHKQIYKFETRNPKQIQMTENHKIQNTLDSDFGVLDFLSLRFI